MALNRFVAPLALLTTLAACASETPIEEPAARHDLRALIGANAEPIAVTVAPDTGDVFVFDRANGLYRVADGAATLVLDMAAMPDPGIEVRLPYTDLVALGGNAFAVTAIGDGFLLDLGANTMALHFCYEPDFIPESFTQRTDAVTYDAASQKIIAQPQTRNELDEVVSSDIGYYDRVTGFDETWYPLNINFAAGGMAVDAGQLFLGEGTGLYRYDRSQNLAVPADDLDRFGIERIDGLAFTADRLLVVDAARGQLVEIDRAQLSE